MLNFLFGFWAEFYLERTLEMVYCILQGDINLWRYQNFPNFEATHHTLSPLRASNACREPQPGANNALRQTY